MGLKVFSDKRVYDNILGAVGHTPLVRLGQGSRYGFTGLLSIEI
jgi:hypothetical protein